MKFVRRNLASVSTAVQRASRRARGYEPGRSDNQLESRTLLSAFAAIPPPSGWVAPQAMTEGPDGNLWYADSGGFGRVSNTGAVTIFPYPTDTGQLPVSIASGPGGALWFVSNGWGSNVGKLMPDGTITTFPLP